MITILHGDFLTASRKKLTDLADAFSGEKIRYEGETLTLTELKQALESSSLFGLKRLLIIERLFSRRESKEKEELLHYLKANPQANLIVWEGKRIDGRKLAAFKQARIEEFKVTPLIFKFLDSLVQGQSPLALRLFHQVLKTEPAELVFFLLCRRVNQLIIAADLGAKGLTSPMAPWQKSRILKQAKSFSLSKLIWFYAQLERIDWSQKTGQASFSLPAQLDLLLTNL